MRFARSFIVATICLPAFFSGCNERSKPEEMPPVTVCAATAKEIVFTEKITAVATVLPYRSIEIIPRVSGFLTARNFVEGSEVPEGTILYIIEQKPYQLQLQKAHAETEKCTASLENAQLEFDRVGKLAEETVLPPKRFDSARASRDEAQATLRAAQAQEASAELEYSYTEMKAPFAGRIGFTQKDVGNYIGVPSPALTTLTDVSQMRIRFFLGNDALNRTGVGRAIARETIPETPVRLYLEDGTPYPETGKITFWSNAFDSQTATLELQAVFANPDRILFPGMFVKVELPTAEIHALAIPANAVRQDLNVSSVFVVTERNTLEMRKVKTNSTSGGMTPILAGLKTGERVVVNGSAMLENGMKVRIQAMAGEVQK